MKKKISFDFDDTLEHEYIQDYAKELINRGYEIHIVTSRYENTDDYPKETPEKYKNSENHLDLYLIADKLGIPNKNIHFTNFTEKFRFFKTHTDFLLHLDDNNTETLFITINTNTKGVDIVNNINWKEICEALLT